MSIQWYPGHMHKAAREIKAALEKVDLTIEILDARLPYSSQNPLLARLQGNKPSIKVLTKGDLADLDITSQWQSFFETNAGIKTLAVGKNQTQRIKQLTGLCRKVAQAEATPDKLVNAMIMGIPNVGKSTLINVLAGRTIAKTGDEPAVTKQQQRIAIEQNVVLFDTPGMLWPNLENKHSSYRLAASGAIKDTALSHEDVVLYLLNYLASAYPEQLKQRFHLTSIADNPADLLTHIGQKRGCMRKGGIVDPDKAAKIVLAEYRSGSLGTITLETPEMMAVELVELEQQRQEKLAKKLAKKAKYPE